MLISKMKYCCREGMGYNKPSSTIRGKKRVTRMTLNRRFFSYLMVKTDQSGICLNVGGRHDADQFPQAICLIMCMLEI